MMRHDERRRWRRHHDDEFFAAARGGRRRGGNRRGPRGPAAGAGPEGWSPGGGPRGPGWGGGRGGGGWDQGDRVRHDLFRSMFGRGARRGRGDVRAAILLLLAEQPWNGYQLMQEIERRSESTWRPSSGSVYPALQQLEDERLVAIETTPSGKVYKLTDRGTEYVAKHRDELGTPWQAERTGDDPRLEVMASMSQIGPALQQVVRFGTPAQLAEARRVIADARRALYRILAEADGDASDDDE